MDTTPTPKIPKLVSHSQYITRCVAAENAILAAGAHAAIREVVNKPTKPISAGKLVVTAADLQVSVADVAYYRSWRANDEKVRGIIFQNVSNVRRTKLQSCLTAKDA